MTLDAIVIGAGLNGLTAAASLARRGRKVLVLERRATIGGSHATEEVFPGFRFDTVSHDAGWIAPSIVRTLELERHGLKLVTPGYTLVSPQSDGGHLALSPDLARSAESIRRHSAADAAAWPAFCGRMHRLTSFLGMLYERPAPIPTSTAPGDLWSLLALGRRARALGREGMIDLLRILPMSAAELLDDWFESAVLKGALGALSVRGIMQGPRSGGTAFVLLHRHAGAPAGAFGAHTVVRGGVGALAGALAASASASGAQVRTSASVRHVLIEGGRATGVVLDSGEEIRARAVLSSADVRQTFYELVDTTALDPEMLRAVGHVRQRGAVAKVNLALSATPAFRSLAGGDGLLSGSIVPGVTLDELERAYDDAKHGGISRRASLEIRIPSLHDGALAPAGKHVMSVRVQFAPYRLADGWTAARREALGDQVVAALAEHAPSLPGTILRRQVLTPLDLETEYRLPEGNLAHGELTLDQILFMRPVAGMARYKTPLDGLYLCGASSHPGDGVAGGAGWLAAKAVDFA